MRIELAARKVYELIFYSPFKYELVFFFRSSEILFASFDHSLSLSFLFGQFWILFYNIYTKLIEFLKPLLLLCRRHSKIMDQNEAREKKTHKQK